jgi:hypothetical protein
VNVIWGLVNFIIGYALIYGVGDFTFGFATAFLMVGLGVIVASVALAFYFGRVRSR